MDGGHTTYASINPNKSWGRKKEKCCGEFKIEKVNFTLLKMKEPSVELKSKQRNESITLSSCCPITLFACLFCGGLRCLRQI
jgi:hypothetical protein